MNGDIALGLEALRRCQRQGRINKCGGPVRKNVCPPPPPHAIESRIESKMVHPFNMDKRPTTILHEL